MRNACPLAQNIIIQLTSGEKMQDVDEHIEVVLRDLVSVKGENNGWTTIQNWKSDVTG